MHKQTPAPPIVIVDDDPEVLDALRLMLNSGGFSNIICLQDSRKVLPLLEKTEVEVILLDLTMPTLGGKDLLTQLAEQHPEASVIIVTGLNELQSAVDCMRLGASDYIVKPVEKARLLSAVQRSIELHDLRRENIALRQRVLTSSIDHPQAFAAIITADPAMLQIFRYMEAVATSPEPIMITGETGTGKELIARALHDLSGRPGPFVAVNAAGFDDHLFSDTLFGHRKGAFTGADSRRQGLVGTAAGGTLFLDEIGDLSLPSQIKLLRLIQEKEYFPLGSDLPLAADIRILAASNCELTALLEQGAFRRDLFYRLQRHHIHVPPLRERLGDLPLLVDHILESAARRQGKNTPARPKSLVPLLKMHTFPGNIRELETILIDALTCSTSGVLSMKSIDALLRQNGITVQPDDMNIPDQGGLFAKAGTLPTLKEASACLIMEAMKRAQGNQTMAARLLGISQPALSKRLK